MLLDLVNKKELMVLEGKLEDALQRLDDFQLRLSLLPNWTNSEQAAHILGVSRSQVYKLVKAGHLERVSAEGGKVAVSVDSLMQYFKGKAGKKRWADPKVYVKPLPQWIRDSGVKLPEEELERQAKLWATRQKREANKLRKQFEAQQQ